LKGIETKSLLVRCTNYGESDKIVTLISQDLGKVKGIAKGARRSIKRFGGCLEPFTLVNMVIRPQKGLSFLEEAHVLKNFKTIKSDLSKIAYGSYMLELTSAMSLEGGNNEGGALYELLLKGIEDISVRKNPEEAAREYDMKILSMMGYLPSFLACAVCNGRLLEGNGRPFLRDASRSPDVGFSWARGGIICVECQKKSGEELSYVSVGTLKTLHAAALRTVSFTKNALAESEEIIPSFIAYHLGKKLKSLDFISSMKGV